MTCFHGCDKRSCLVCCDERADNMLWGEQVHHSVGGGLAKKRMHTKRASAQSINNCEHGLRHASAWRAAVGNRGVIMGL